MTTDPCDFKEDLERNGAVSKSYIYDETYQVLVSAARTKMIMNQHKGMIHDKGPWPLIDPLHAEIKELVEALYNKDPERIIEEAGDVLNFLVGIAHNALEAYRSKKTMATSRTIGEAEGQ